MKNYSTQIGIFTLTFLAAIFLGLSTLKAQSNAYAGLPAPVVTSDKLDYAPGEIARITGTGWTLDDSVHVEFKETPDYPDFHIYDIDVDVNGNWKIDYQVEQRHVGVTFTVTADGKQSRYRATTIFTDANVRVTTSGGSVPVSFIVKSSTNCSGSTVSSGTRTATTSQGDFNNIAVTSTQSVQLTVPLVNSLGQVFTGFTSSTPFTTPDPANPNTICVNGNVSNGAVTFQANYVACTTPTITCPAAVTVSCASAVPAAATDSTTFVAAGGTVRDNCPGAPTITSADVISNQTCANRYTIVRTYTATNAAGQTNTCTQTITVNDQTAPTITKGTIGSCYKTAAAAEAAALAATTATDNCTGTITYAASTTGTCSAVVTVTATDVCGNQSSTTYNTRIDNILPVITVAAAATLGCNPTADEIAAAFGNATVTDNCSTGLIATGTVGAETGTGCTRSTTKTFTVTDNCGNTATTTQTVTYTRDTQDPVITVTAAATLGCNPTAAQIAAAFGTATVEDNCSTDLTATGTVGTEIGSGCTYSTTKTFTVTDNCGNTATTSQTVTYTRDTQDPVITVTAATPLGCNPTAAQIAAAFGNASVTDNCSTGLTATGTVGTETGSGCTYSTTKTFTVTDNCGNTATTTQTVTYTRDTQDPVITVTAATPLGCNPTAAQIAAAFGNASVTDNCSTGLTATGTVGTETGSGCTYSTTKTFTVTDNCGNTATTTQTVTYTRDTQDPVITVTAATPLGCNPTAAQIAAAFGDASVTDNCSTGLTATGTVGTETGSGCTYSTTKTFTVTDNCGNTATTTQTVTYTRDTQDPVITVTAATPLGCNPTAAQIAAAFGDASVTDNCSTGLTATGTVGTETGSGCTYSTTKTFTVTDNCGNTATTTQTVTYTRDTQDPVITVTAATPLGCNPTAAQIAAAFGDASVTDNCSTGLTATGTVGAETGTGCTRSTTKTFTVTDNCGNTATTTQTVTYTRDTQDPVITVTAATPLGCNPTAAQIAAAFGNASVTDNCSTGLTATGTVGAETGTGCTRSTTKTFTVTDNCGNTATTTQIVTYTKDITPPVVNSCPSSFIVYTGPGRATCDQTVTWTEPNATDNCSGPLTYYSRSHIPGSVFSVGNTVVTYTFKDGCGNTSTCSFTVTVSDNTAPTINCPSNITLSACQSTATWTAPNATDNCPGVTVTKTAGPASGSTFANGSTTTITYTATDASNNNKSCSFTVTRAPVLVATCGNTNPVLYFGYTGDQSSTISGTPTGGTGPYTVTITMNRPLICNSINSAGDEIFTPTGATSASNYTCPTIGSNTVAPVASKSGVAAGVAFNVNVTLLADAVFTITVTDAKGCTSTCTTAVSAEDVRCFAGNSSQQKYTICHKTGSSKNPCVTICVDENAVNEHLAHGDVLGLCPKTGCPAPATTTAITGRKAISSEESSIDKLTVKAMPNPSMTQFTLLLKSSKNDRVNIRILDIAGRVIEEKMNVLPNSSVQFGSNYFPGVYIAELIQGKEKISVKLIKAYR